MDYEVNCQIKDCSCKVPTKPKPHKWAKEIKAWADGAVIQFNTNPVLYDWEDVRDFTPVWGNVTYYRIKPEPKPDIVKFIGVLLEDDTLYAEVTSISSMWENKVSFTFAGETNKLKSVEIIK